MYIEMLFRNLPESEENYSLDWEKLPHWMDWFEEFPRALVEVNQAVESDDLRYGVH